MGAYCLILSETENENLKVLSFLISALGLPEKEAKSRLRATPGFLLENAGLEQAKAAHIRAAAAGLKTMVIETPSLPTMPQPVDVSRIEFKSDGFYYQNKVQKDFVRYDSLTMTAAAAIEIFLQPKTPVELETDLIKEIRNKLLPAILVLKPEKGRQPAPRTPQPQKEIVFYSDIFSSQSNPPHPTLAPKGLDGIRLRFRNDEFDFSGLGAVKTYSSTENFRLILEELEARTFSKLFMNRAFIGIKKRTPMKDFVLPSLEAYEKELLWLACLNLS